MTDLLATTPLARTPPMGFNTWNKFGCSGISGQVLMDMADRFIDLGLKEAHYEFINSDDCWMQLDRPDGGKGPQVPNPEKFPHGIRPVADYIHSKGLKIGLYTARSSTTCAGFAASCDHELVDVTEWANWTVDYMKDDSCGYCGRPVEVDYGVMQSAINDVGRPILLTIEGSPDIEDVHTGCCGNARRVGHDIEPRWLSMTSLVDTGAGLWPYAHNGSLSTVENGGGFWNDLDMLELGNGVFNASLSTMNAAMARSHFSLWAVMKAVLLLGCDLDKITPATLAIVKNPEAIAINQDVWGKQARRVAVKAATNTTVAAPWHSIVVAARCASSSISTSTSASSQVWHLAEAPTQDDFSHLWLAPCNTSDIAQQWNLSSHTLRSLVPGAGCVDSADDEEFFAPLLPCTSNRSATEVAAWNVTTQHLHVGAKKRCLDVFDNEGPNVFVGGCKVPGEEDANQRFAPFSAAQPHMLKSMLSSSSLFVSSASSSAERGDATAVGQTPIGDVCLSARSTLRGSALYTVDAAGQAWCAELDAPPTPVIVTRCDPTHQKLSLMKPSAAWALGVDDEVTKKNTHRLQNFGRGDRLQFLDASNTFGQSGPVPHTRWSNSNGYGAPLIVDPVALSDPTRGAILQMASTEILDDDSIGGKVETGGKFCFAVDSGSVLETWVGELSPDPSSGARRWTVALFNRSPSPDAMEFPFNLLPLPQEPAGVSSASTSFVVRGIWTNTTHPATSGASFSTTVGAYDTALLVVTETVA